MNKKAATEFFKDFYLEFYNKETLNYLTNIILIKNYYRS